MKFRDPKTGEVFDNIDSARREHCSRSDCNTDCKIEFKLPGCAYWSIGNPTEAVRLMGFEVMEDKEEPMEKKEMPHTCKNCGNNETKTGCGSCTCSNDDPNNPSGWTPVRPRICQVLGVEVGERFRVESDSCCIYHEAFVDEDEIVRASVGYAMDGMRICQIIKGELRIIRKPRFTEEEVADARSITTRLFWNAVSLSKYANGVVWVLDKNSKDIGRTSKGMFPSPQAGADSEARECYIKEVFGAVFARLLNVQD